MGSAVGGAGLAFRRQSVTRTSLAAASFVAQRDRRKWNRFAAARAATVLGGANSPMMKKQIMDYWWLILVSVTSGVAGQTALKLGLSQPGAAEGVNSLASLITTIFTSPLVLLGLGLYALGALAWIAVLSRMDLSLAYPFLALNFVLVALVSKFFLGETIPAMRWAGIAVICAGILLVARSSFQ